MYYIYRITNKINGKTYIGQHKYKKLNDSYMGSGVYLAKAKKKYGIENFEKEILYSHIQYKETADDVERFAIAKERAIGKAEYNIADGGLGSAGFHHTEEHKQKLSEAMKGNQYSKGKRMSDEQKRKISESLKGIVPWWKGKTSPHKGHKQSEEVKRRLSEINKGKKGYWLGKHISEETKKKLSEINKGNTHNKGKPKSEEHKKNSPKLRKENIGNLLTEKEFGIKINY